MLSNIKDVDFSDMTNALPAFCTVVFMPFTYSIANGVAVGLIMYCLIKLLTGKAKEVKGLTWIISIVFVLRYAFMTLDDNRFRNENFCHDTYIKNCSAVRM